jgi:hypothetical protein
MAQEKMLRDAILLRDQTCVLACGSNRKTLAKKQLA